MKDARDKSLIFSGIILTCIGATFYFAPDKIFSPIAATLGAASLLGLAAINKWPERVERNGASKVAKFKG